MKPDQERLSELVADLRRRHDDSAASAIESLARQLTEANEQIDLLELALESKDLWARGVEGQLTEAEREPGRYAILCDLDSPGLSPAGLLIDRGSRTEALYVDEVWAGRLKRWFDKPFDETCLLLSRSWLVAAILDTGDSQSVAPQSTPKSGSGEEAGGE